MTFAAKEHGLDGTSWKIHVKPEGITKDRGEKDFDETLVFAGGKLMTPESSQLGFDATRYTLIKTGHDDYNFSAEQDGDNSGKYVWTGTIDDEDIKGRLVWTKEDGTVLTYSF